MTRNYNLNYNLKYRLTDVSNLEFWYNNSYGRLPDYNLPTNDNVLSSTAGAKISMWF